MVWSNWETIDKFGRLSDIGQNETKDLWNGPEDLAPFPSSAAATTIESDDADDAAGGTGVEQCQVFGAIAGFFERDEIVVMDGETPVTLANQYLRVNRVTALDVGSGEKNAGTITVQHGATVLAQIDPLIGQTLMAVWTTPADYVETWIIGMWGSLGRQAAAFGDLNLITRRDGKAWQTKRTLYLHSNGSNPYYLPLKVPVLLHPKTDVLIQVNDVSANNVAFSGGFDGYGYKGAPSAKRRETILQIATGT